MHVSLQSGRPYSWERRPPLGGLQKGAPAPRGAIPNGVEGGGSGDGTPKILLCGAILPARSSVRLQRLHATIYRPCPQAWWRPVGGTLGARRGGGRGSSLPELYEVCIRHSGLAGGGGGGWEAAWSGVPWRIGQRG
jgi:hypothetical protein